MPLHSIPNCADDLASKGSAGGYQTIRASAPVAPVRICRHPYLQWSDHGEWHFECLCVAVHWILPGRSERRGDSGFSDKRQQAPDWCPAEVLVKSTIVNTSTFDRATLRAATRSRICCTSGARHFQPQIGQPDSDCNSPFCKSSCLLTQCLDAGSAGESTSPFCASAQVKVSSSWTGAPKA